MIARGMSCVRRENAFQNARTIQTVSLIKIVTLGVAGVWTSVSISTIVKWTIMFVRTIIALSLNVKAIGIVHRILNASKESVTLSSAKAVIVLELDKFASGANAMFLNATTQATASAKIAHVLTSTATFTVSMTGIVQAKSASKVHA